MQAGTRVTADEDDGRGMADCSIGICPAPGQNEGAAYDEVACTGEPHPQHGAHQQHEQYLAGRSSGGGQWGSGLLIHDASSVGDAARR